MQDPEKYRSMIRVEDTPLYIEIAFHEKVALRDGVIDEIGSYCAELSQTLWIDYSSILVPSLLNMEWNDDLHLAFLGYRRLIDRNGLYGAGELILLGMRELIGQKQ